MGNDSNQPQDPFKNFKNAVKKIVQVPKDAVGKPSTKPKRYHYKVTLKTGDYSVFPNDNNYPDYESRLVSGMYGISTADGRFVSITRDNVASIEKVEVEE